MLKYLAVLFAVLAPSALVSPAQAQHHGHGGQPYAAIKDRPVKALAADDIAGLRAGRGRPSSTAIPGRCMRWSTRRRWR